jgi:hypothetical protein
MVDAEQKRMNLPLVNNAFLIDNSGLELLRCPREFYYTFIRRRRLRANKAGMNFGSTMHVGWDVRYSHCGRKACSPEVEQQAIGAMREWLEANPQPMGDFRTLGKAEAVLKEYNRIYQDEPWEILTNPKDGLPLVEKSFMLPFMTIKYQVPLEGFDQSQWEIGCYIIDELAGHVTLLIQVYYCGKLDLATRDALGIWAGPDHKTAFMFGEGFEKDMQRNPGQRGYVWALWQITGIKPHGYIIDAVRTRKEKRTNIFEKSFDDASEPGSPTDAKDFKRMPFLVSEDDLQNWVRNTQMKIREVFAFAERNEWPEHENQCVRKYSICDFFDVCTCNTASRESALMGDLYEDNRWSPLQKPKTKEG